MSTHEPFLDGSRKTGNMVEENRDILLTLPEAANLLGWRSVKALSAACKAKRIPGAMKIGGRWRIHKGRLLSDSTKARH